MGKRKSFSRHSKQEPIPVSSSIAASSFGLSEAFLIVLITGAASALFGAMVAGIFTLDLDGIANAAWLLISKGLFEAVGVGIGVAIAISLVAAIFDRSSALAVGALAGLLVFSGWALYWVVITAWRLSAWGCGIGGTVGAVLGVTLAIGAGKSGRSSASLRKAVRRAEASKGIPPSEVEWWRVDPDDDGGPDGD